MLPSLLQTHDPTYTYYPITLILCIDNTTPNTTLLHTRSMHLTLHYPLHPPWIDYLPTTTTTTHSLTIDPSHYYLLNLIYYLLTHTHHGPSYYYHHYTQRREGPSHTQEDLASQYTHQHSLSLLVTTHFIGRILLLELLPYHTHAIIHRSLTQHYTYLLHTYYHR